MRSFDVFIYFAIFTKICASHVTGHHSTTDIIVTQPGLVHSTKDVSLRTQYHIIINSYAILIVSEHTAAPQMGLLSEDKKPYNTR